MAARSINRYQDLERESGVAFHVPVGFMAVAGDALGAYAARCRATAAAGEASGLLGAGSVEELAGAEAMASRLPGLGGLRRLPGRVGAQSAGLLEPPAGGMCGGGHGGGDDGEGGSGGTAGVGTAGAGVGAGHVSARRLLAAQQRAAALKGAVRFDEPAMGVRPAAVHTPPGGDDDPRGGKSGGGWLSVRLAVSGRVLTARRAVLVCTNASTNLAPLLPGPPVALRLDTQTTVRRHIQSVRGRGLGWIRRLATKRQLSGHAALRATCCASAKRAVTRGAMARTMARRMQVRLVLRAEDARRLDGMPSLVLKFDADDHGSSQASPTGEAGEAVAVDAATSADAAPASFWALDSVYVLPPILYATEGHAIKAGHGKVRGTALGVCKGHVFKINHCGAWQLC